MNWAIVPFIDCWEQTKACLLNLLFQNLVPEVKLLAIDNGSSENTRHQLDQMVEAWAGRLYAWHHNPPMSSLAATWNAALDFVWQCGGEHALVCNNDIRLHPTTYRLLVEATRNPDSLPLFVSAVGVTEEQYRDAWKEPPVGECCWNEKGMRGGPDFSCYLITKECHQKYRFDEGFTPAYCEDLDFHRRMMLGGDGQRIYSVNVPYLHIDRGSGTLKSWDPVRRANFEKQITFGSRAYYERKWGGPVNREAWITPFEGGTPIGGATTPELFERERNLWRGL